MALKTQLQKLINEYNSLVARLSPYSEERDYTRGDDSIALDLASHKREDEKRKTSKRYKYQPYGLNINDPRKLKYFDKVCNLDGSAKPFPYKKGTKLAALEANNLKKTSGFKSKKKKPIITRQYLIALFTSRGTAHERARALREFSLMEDVIAPDYNHIGSVIRFSIILYRHCPSMHLIDKDLEIVEKNMIMKTYFLNRSLLSLRGEVQRLKHAHRTLRAQKDYLERFKVFRGAANNLSPRHIYDKEGKYLDLNMEEAWAHKEKLIADDKVKEKERRAPFYRKIKMLRELANQRKAGAIEVPDITVDNLSDIRTKDEIQE